MKLDKGTPPSAPDCEMFEIGSHGAATSSTSSLSAFLAANTMGRRLLEKSSYRIATERER
jgi:hypothetical protein